MSVGANVTEPVVSERIEPHSDLATEAAKFLLEYATHRTQGDRFHCTSIIFRTCSCPPARN